MERAHREISDLAGMLQGDRVGLVLFAGGAYMRMPLTTITRRSAHGAADVDDDIALKAATSAAIRWPHASSDRTRRPGMIIIP